MSITETIQSIKATVTTKFPMKKKHYIGGIILDVICIALILFIAKPPLQDLISPLAQSRLQPLTSAKKGYEVFGFAPHWNINKLDNIDYNVLTTLAYFGISIGPDGEIDPQDPGYVTFQSDKATALFKKAHAHGTRVVLTITQMDNAQIRALMDDQNAQVKVINTAVGLVRTRGIDGINVDFEYMGNPGDAYRQKFTEFINALTDEMHQQVPSSQVTVSVYASAIKDPKIYDLHDLSKKADGIFMMAYDFAVAGSDNAMPTAPLHGHKEGKYWYDVASAVQDFLAVMPANKLIMGVPWYGYNYLVYKPGEKAETRPYYSWKGTPTAQTYSYVQENVQAEKTGWDKEGEVGWKAYYVAETDTWRMIYIDDAKSLSIKYDFAKENHLKGVGMWALGMEGNSSEMWAVLSNKFGNKLADSTVQNKDIN